MGCVQSSGDESSRGSRISRRSGGDLSTTVSVHPHSFDGRAPQSPSSFLRRGDASLGASTVLLANITASGNTLANTGSSTGRGAVSITRRTTVGAMPATVAQLSSDLPLPVAAAPSHDKVGKGGLFAGGGGDVAKHQRRTQRHQHTGTASTTTIYESGTLGGGGGGGSMVSTMGGSGYAANPLVAPHAMRHHHSGGSTGPRFHAIKKALTGSPAEAESGLTSGGEQRMFGPLPTVPYSFHLPADIKRLRRSILRCRAAARHHEGLYYTAPTSESNNNNSATPSSLSLPDDNCAHEGGDYAAQPHDRENVQLRPLQRLSTTSTSNSPPLPHGRRSDDFLFTPTVDPHSGETSPQSQPQVVNHPHAAGRPTPHSDDKSRRDASDFRSVDDATPNTHGRNNVVSNTHPQPSGEDEREPASAPLAAGSTDQLLTFHNTTTQSSSNATPSTSYETSTPASQSIKHVAGFGTTHTPNTLAQHTIDAPRHRNVRTGGDKADAGAAHGQRADLKGQDPMVPNRSNPTLQRITRDEPVPKLEMPPIEDEEAIIVGNDIRSPHYRSAAERVPSESLRRLAPKNAPPHSHVTIAEKTGIVMVRSAGGKCRRWRIRVRPLHIHQLSVISKLGQEWFADEAPIISSVRQQAANRTTNPTCPMSIRSALEEKATCTTLASCRRVVELLRDPIGRTLEVFREQSCPRIQRRIIAARLEHQQRSNPSSFRAQPATVASSNTPLVPAGGAAAGSHASFRGSRVGVSFDSSVLRSALRVVFQEQIPASIRSVVCPSSSESEEEATLRRFHQWQRRSRLSAKGNKVTSVIDTAVCQVSANGFHRVARALDGDTHMRVCQWLGSHGGPRACAASQLADGHTPPPLLPPRRPIFVEDCIPSSSPSTEAEQQQLQQQPLCLENEIALGCQIAFLSQFEAFLRPISLPRAASEEEDDASSAPVCEETRDGNYPPTSTEKATTNGGHTDDEDDAVSVRSLSSVDLW